MLGITENGFEMQQWLTLKNKRIINLNKQYNSVECQMSKVERWMTLDFRLLDFRL